MHVTWLGHAAFLLEGKHTSVLVDPFLSGRPSPVELPASAHPTVILVTHGHHDHLGDAVELSKQHEAPIVAVPELAGHCADQGAASERVNYGGAVSVGDALVRCVPAVHTSSIGPERIPAGNPCGFVVTLDGTRVYHAGDTCAFGDMRLIGDEAPLDVALLPIGGRFTMDPAGALVAVKLLRPRVVVPMHFNTFPLIQQDGEAFASSVSTGTSAVGIVLEPGRQYDLGEEDLRSPPRVTEV